EQQRAVLVVTWPGILIAGSGRGNQTTDAAQPRPVRRTATRVVEAMRRVVEYLMPRRLTLECGLARLRGAQEVHRDRLTSRAGGALPLRARPDAGDGPDLPPRRGK